MLSEVIKLDPKLDEQGLNKMFNTLNRRFTQLAKSFGKGMDLAMKAAPLLDLVGKIVSKIVSPLDRAEEVIDRILGKAGDITDAAEEFDTTTGNLSVLEAAGLMKGVGRDIMRTMVRKFQTDLAQERRNAEGEAEAISRGEKPKTQPGLLRNFIGIDDTAEAFFSFVQSMQKLDPKDRILAQTQIFGERMRGKVAAFLNEPNFPNLLKELPTATQYQTSIANADSVGDRMDYVTTLREEYSSIKKNNMVNMTMPESYNRVQAQKDKEETEALARYNKSAEAQIAMGKLIGKADTFITEMMNTFLPKAVQVIEIVVEWSGKLEPYIKQLQGWSSTTIDTIFKKITDISTAIENAYKRMENLPFFKSFGGGKK